MATRKNVSASVVRTFLATPEGVAALKAAGAPTPGARGRIHADSVAVFHKHNPRSQYETASEAQKPTVEVPVTMLDKAGRKTTRKVTITTEAARAALGHPKGQRGRFALDTLSLALSAAEADKVAKSFK